MKRKLAGSLFASLLFASLAMAASTAPATPAVSRASGDAPSLFAPVASDCSDVKAVIAPADRLLDKAALANFCGQCSGAVACRGANLGAYCSGVQKTCQPTSMCPAEGPGAWRCICTSIIP